MALRRATWRYVAMGRAVCPLRVYHPSARGLSGSARAVARLGVAHDARRTCWLLVLRWLLDAGCVVTCTRGAWGGAHRSTCQIFVGRAGREGGRARSSWIELWADHWRAVTHLASHAMMHVARVRPPTDGVVVASVEGRTGALGGPLRTDLVYAASCVLGRRACMCWRACVCVRARSVVAV